VACIINDPDGVKRIGFVDRNRKRKAIYLGQVPDRVAEEWKDRVQDLNAFAKHNTPLDTAMVAWLGDLPDPEHAKLAKVGLVAPRVLEPEPEPEPGVLPGDFLEAYILSRRTSRSEPKSIIAPARPASSPSSRPTGPSTPSPPAMPRTSRSGSRPISGQRSTGHIPRAR
jgi:hypothetical protein